MHLGIVGRWIALASLVAACSEETGTVRIVARCEAAACGVAGSLRAKVTTPATDLEEVWQASPQQVTLMTGTEVMIDVPGVSLGDWSAMAWVDANSNGKDDTGDAVPNGVKMVSVTTAGQIVTIMDFSINNVWP